MNCTAKWPFAAALALTMVTPSLGSAQSNAKPQGRVAVLVVVAETRAANAATIVSRNPRLDQYMIVMSAASASPAKLANAAMLATALMERDGDHSRDEKVFRIADDASAPAKETSAAAKVLAEIRSSPASHVQGLGNARSAYVYVPNHASREKARKNGKGAIRWQ